VPPSASISSEAVCGISVMGAIIHTA
jgi:hypothetical protein